MKRIPCITALLLALSLAGGAALAESIHTHLKASIPFDFVVGETTLLAGEYEVRSLGWSSPAIWLIQLNGPQVANALTNREVAYRPHEGARETVLIFNRYGDTYFLSRVTLAGFEQAKVLIKTGREKEMEKTASLRTTVRVAATQTARVR